MDPSEPCLLEEPHHLVRGLHEASCDDELQERDRFIRELKSQGGSGQPLHGLFDGKLELGIARAPGRLDVMGGIADYSGSLVLEWPTREAAWAAVQVHPERSLRVASRDPAAPSHWRQATLPIDPLLTLEPRAVGTWLRQCGAGWAGYVVGALALLPEVRRRSFQGGLRVAICSNVPEGKGVSSSAAIEVAAYFALAKVLGWAVDAREAALACQRVENQIVGAPCGAMDQLTSACGLKGRLLEVLCQPATVLNALTLPEDLELFGIDSGQRHAIRDPAYGRVRAAAFMGLRILTSFARSGAGQEEEPFGGYLANVSPSQLDSGMLERLPEFMTGAEFSSRYGALEDTVSVIEASGTYPVRTATAHPIREHHRVRLFAELLRGLSGADRHDGLRARELLGELMYQSHASYSACGLGAPGTDRLVALAREVGAGGGVFGAKISGGGSGGTVVVLVARSARAAIDRIAKQYASETGVAAQVFSGTSAGAGEFGATSVMLD
ncbi:MAG TPA: hypothetical protein VFQ61_35220 [Polyangiaceae bacterium]|nr:hypothetical protein [Polyangiaceae bacterium]